MRSEKVKIDDIVEHFGSVPKAAAQLKVSRQTIYNWLAARKLPSEVRAIQVSHVTGGRFTVAELPVASQ